MCRMLIQAQSNIICSIFLSLPSAFRSIKLITVLSFGLGRAKRGDKGEAEGSKQRANGILWVEEPLPLLIIMKS